MIYIWFGLDGTGIERAVSKIGVPKLETPQLMRL